MRGAVLGRAGATAVAARRSREDPPGAAVRYGARVADGWHVPRIGGVLPGGRAFGRPPRAGPEGAGRGPELAESGPSAGCREEARGRV